MTECLDFWVNGSWSIGAGVVGVVVDKVVGGGGNEGLQVWVEVPVADRF